MKIIESKTRTEYLRIQIAASRKKFKYCKVSVACISRFKEIINRGNNNVNIKGPILCLGTRNGREIDLFRIIFFGNRLRNLIIKLLEVHKYGFSSLFRIVETFGKSDVNRIDKKSVVGVELNPDGERKDVLIGSFDELPRDWACKFKIIYANTIDHAQDPYRTAQEWNRVLEPGGYFILGNGGIGEPSQIGCVGNLTLEDLRQLFPGELIYFNRFGNRYSDIIIQKK